MRRKRPLIDFIVRYRNELFLGAMVGFMAIAVFVFFHSFFSKNLDAFSTEILAALLGSIFTVMITMLLIRHQGTIERAQETAATSKNIVFERKLELFKEFISVYVRCAADGELSDEELAELEDLALTISLFTKDVPIGPDLEDLGEELCRFVLQLELFGLRTRLEPSEYSLFDRALRRPNTPAGERELLSFVHILRLMKIELGVAQSDSDEVEAELMDFEEYEWTRRLLAYRQSRRAVSNSDGRGETMD